MIQYSLICDSDHRFEAWFRSAQAFDEQQSRGIVTCPACGSASVAKAVMAPAVGRSDNAPMALTTGHPRQAELMQALRAVRDKVVAEADYVGDRFAEEARRIYFEETEPHGIYGEATREEATALAEDGISFLPLPILPEEHN